MSAGPMSAGPIDTINMRGIYSANANEPDRSSSSDAVAQSRLASGRLQRSRSQVLRIKFELGSP